MRLIYAASVDDRGWRSFLDVLDRELDGVYLSLYGHDLLNGRVIETVVTRYPEEKMSDYHAYYGSRNPFIAPIARAPSMLIQRSEGWIPEEDLVQTEFYNDFLKLSEDVYTGGGGAILNQNGALLIMSGQVRRRDGDDKADQLIETIKFLAPHLRQAFKIRRAIANSELSSSNVHELLAKIPGAAFILDCNGKVVSKNHTASQILSKGNVCSYSPVEELHFLDQQMNHILRDEICLMKMGSVPTSATRYVLSTDGLPYMVSLLPFIREQDPELLFDRVVQRHHALLIIRGSQEANQTGIDALKAAFGLSDAEAAVAVSLFEGVSTNKQAEERHVSIHTIRSQLKSLLRKTGSDGQIRLLATIRHFLN